MELFATSGVLPVMLVGLSLRVVPKNKQKRFVYLNLYIITFIIISNHEKNYLKNYV